jgi:hypothetical protein
MFASSMYKIGLFSSTTRYKIQNTTVHYLIMSSPMEARLKKYIGSSTLSQTMPIQYKKDTQFSDVETKRDPMCDRICFLPKRVPGMLAQT